MSCLKVREIICSHCPYRPGGEEDYEKRIAENYDYFMLQGTLRWNKDVFLERPDVKEEVLREGKTICHSRIERTGSVPEGEPVWCFGFFHSHNKKEVDND